MEVYTVYLTDPASRSEQGARDCATLRSVLSTERKWGLKEIEALLTPLEKLCASLKS